MLRKFAKYLRDEAQKDFESCILECVEGHHGTLLDCGCDDGAWTIKLLTRTNRTQAYGIELVETATKLALNRGIHVVKADLNYQFPFKENSFDIVTQIKSLNICLTRIIFCMKSIGY